MVGAIRAKTITADENLLYRNVPRNRVPSGRVGARAIRGRRGIGAIRHPAFVADG
jgi:hypothetical protein